MRPIAAQNAPAMQSFTTWRGLPAAAQGATVALGNFDGVHRGHAALLAAARAVRPGAALGVLTFEPHPREIFRPDDPPFRLTDDAGRAAALAAHGVDLLFTLRFDAAFARMAADAFIDDVLAAGLGAGALVTGPDFAFGHQREGDGLLLKARAASHGIAHLAVPALADEGGPISSSRVRHALHDGRPEAAAALMGRPWSIGGIVQRGDARGRQLGFPTANLSLGRHLCPARGVYAVRVRLPDGTGRDGVANIGARPTVGGTDIRLEAHLFEYGGDLYDQRIEVALQRFLRPEQRFPSLDALRAQIAADAAHARAHFARDAAA